MSAWDFRKKLYRYTRFLYKKEDKLSVIYLYFSAFFHFFFLFCEPFRAGRCCSISCSSALGSSSGSSWRTTRFLRLPMQFNPIITSSLALMQIWQTCSTARNSTTRVLKRKLRQASKQVWLLMPVMRWISAFGTLE